MKAKSAEESSEQQPKPKAARMSRVSKPSEIAVSDDKWIQFFAKDAERKHTMKETAAKNTHDLEVRKLEIREKELGIERRRLDIEARKLFIPYDE